MNGMNEGVTGTRYKSLTRVEAEFSEGVSAGVDHSLPKRRSLQGYLCLDYYTTINVRNTVGMM